MKQSQKAQRNHTYCPKCIQLGWVPPEKSFDSVENPQGLCLFHLEKKDLPDNVFASFNDKIHERIESDIKNGKTINLSGTIFPLKITFSKKDFPAANFAFCRFCNDVTFENVTFAKNEGTIFSHSIFLRNFSIKDTKFYGNIYFDFSILMGHTDIKHIHFHGDESSFRHTTFGEFTTFRFSKFKNSKTTFDGATFKDMVDFFGCEFFGEGNFIHSTFHDRSVFSATTFSRKSTFQNSSFFGTTDFFGSKFKKLIIHDSIFSENSKVDFTRSKFHKIFIKNVDFLSSVDFTQSKFYHSAFFQKVHFFKEAIFFNCTFNVCAIFYRSFFSKLAQFDKSIFSKIVVFKNSYFSNSALFIDSIFPRPLSNNRLDFSNSHVDEQHKIRIKNAQLDIFRTFNIDITSFRFENCTWPRDKHGFLRIYEEDTSCNDSIKLETIYRALKRNAISSRSEFQASDWHYKEKVYAYKNLLKNKKRYPLFAYIFYIMFYNTYRLSSGYGELPCRALFVLFCLVILPLIIYSTIALYSTGFSWTIDTPTVAVITKKWIAYIPFIKQHFAVNSSSKILFSAKESILSALTQILIAIQSALFAFALRNKFRR